MNDSLKVSIILPSLNPDDKLLLVINSLTAEGFDDIIIVNDGSDAERTHFFDDAKKHPQCTVLTHEINQGKGRALKTALSYFLENRPDAIGAVTVDGDNQHRAKDILACAKKMAELKNKVILGVRDFSLPQVPPRSRFGNTLTSFVFRTGCGLDISDTQTGLRALPRNAIEIFVNTIGERFEYETNMLLDMKKYRIDYEEVSIETVYIEENASSHFRPIADSLKIYRQLIKFLFSSFSSFIVDYLIFIIIGFILRGKMSDASRLFVQIIPARIVSSCVNFMMNKRLVFTCKKQLRKTFFRYYALCIPQMIISWLLINGAVKLLSVGSGFAETIIKIIVDVVLFIISFRIQRDWVFKEEKKHIVQ